MIYRKQSNGLYSFEGYSEVPMERMTYQEDLDFPTRKPDARDLLPEANDTLRGYRNE